MIFNPGFLCRRVFPAILLVLLAGIIVYANTFHVPFVLDDDRSIARNAVIKNLDNFYANSSGYEFLPNRYVACLTLALNYHFGGLDVFGYHAVNLLIHLMAALLVYTLLRLTFRTPFFQVRGKEACSGSVEISASTSTFCSSLLAPSCFIPLFAALLFVVHPVQTQAVTYIVQRMTSLAAMFYLLSLVLYVLARLGFESRGKRQKVDSEDAASSVLNRGSSTSRNAPMLLACSVLAAVLAMKTKEIAFTLPFAVVLYEVCFFRGAWMRRLLFLLPLLATLPIVPMTVIGIGGSAGDILSDAGDQLRVGGGMSRLEYLFTQFRVIATYLRLLILPINQNLDYDYPVFTTFFTPPVFLSFLLLTAILALAGYLFRLNGKEQVKQVTGAGSGEVKGQVEKRKGSDPAAIGKGAFSHTEPKPESAFSSAPASSCFRLISFGIFWFFLTLAVESSLIPIVDVIFEHRLYLPGFGAAVVFGTAFWLLAGRFANPANARLLVLGAVLVILGLGFATYQRNHTWGNAIRLWQDVVSKSPNKGRPNNNLGVALEEAGRRPEAFKALAQAIAVDPGYYRSYYNLADLYLVSGQPETALPLLQSAIKLMPDFSEAYVLMSAALMREGRFREIIIFLEQNFDLIEEHAEGRFYLGAAYAFLGNREAAMRELKVVSQLDPELAATLAGLLGMSPNRLSHE